MGGEPAVVDLGVDGITDAVLVGTGGAARVYRARQSALDRTVAVKVLLSVDDAQRRRFERESRALGRVSEHRGIVTVYQVGVTDQGLPYLVMRYCPDGSLRDQIDQLGVIPWRTAVGHLAEVASTVADTHGSGVIHRDLKPANILIASNGAPLIADFGIAAILDTAGGSTRSASFTPAYAPPEALAGAEPSPPGDIYSLGATLVAALSGTLPYAPDGKVLSIAPLMARIVNDDIDDHRPPGIPDPVWQLIVGAMAKDPAARPDARTFAEQCQQVLVDADPAPLGPAIAAPPLAPVNTPPTHVGPGPAADADPASPNRPGHDLSAPLAPAVGAFPRQDLMARAAAMDDDQSEDGVISTAPTGGRSPVTALLLVALLVVALAVTAYLLLR